MISAASTLATCWDPAASLSSQSLLCKVIVDVVMIVMMMTMMTMKTMMAMLLMLMVMMMTMTTTTMMMMKQVSLCVPGWPGAHYADQPRLRLT